MSSEDGVMVVIIENPTQKRAPRKQNLMPRKETNTRQKKKPAKQLKQLKIEEVLNNVQKHGEPVNLISQNPQPDQVKVKEEVTDDFEEYEYLEDIHFEPEIQFKAEPSSDPEDPEYQVDDDEDEEDMVYIDDSIRKGEKADKPVHRYTMLKANERHSYVEDLRKLKPKYRKDKNALVEAVSKLMTDQLKPPELPNDVILINSNTSYECRICGAEKRSHIGAHRHYQEKHGPRFLICYACGVDFRSLTNLYKHEKRCAAPDAPLVLRARALVVMRRDPGRPFAQPKRTPVKPVKQSFQCSYCRAVFVSKEGLHAHERMHRGERPYRCTQCGAAYTSAPSLRRHTFSHSEKTFMCDHCDFRSWTKSTMATHCAKHLPQKRFACSEAGCARRYATKAGMLLHVDTAHRALPPPLRCVLCDTRFRRMYLLKQHMLQLHKMHLITKKMFYKKLPKLSTTELEEAKVVYKDDEQYDAILVDDAQVTVSSSGLEVNKAWLDHEPEPAPAKKKKKRASTKRKPETRAPSEETENDDNIASYMDITDHDEETMDAQYDAGHYAPGMMEHMDDSQHSMGSEFSEGYLDMASGNCEVIDNAESFSSLLKDGDKYQVYVIEEGRVTKKINFDDIKDKLLQEYLNKK